MVRAKATDAPPFTQQHLRELNNDVDDTGRAVERLKNETLNNNKQLNSNVQLLSDQVAEIAATQATLAAQQITLNSQITLLQNQVEYYTSPFTSTVATGASGGIVLQAFSSTYDLSAVVQTGASGKLVIDLSCYMASGSTSTTIGLGYGASWSGGSQNVDELRSAVLSGTSAALTLGRASLIIAAPYSVVTIQTRRWSYGAASGMTHGNQSMTVTKLG